MYSDILSRRRTQPRHNRPDVWRNCTAFRIEQRRSLRSDLTPIAPAGWSFNRSLHERHRQPSLRLEIKQRIDRKQQSHHQAHYDDEQVVGREKIARRECAPNCECQESQCNKQAEKIQDFEFFAHQFSVLRFTSGLAPLSNLFVTTSFTRP